LFSYLRDCALHKGQNRLIIKEVYSGFDHPHPLSNLKTTNAIIASGAPVIAIVRDPFDTVASTLKVVKRYVSGLPRRVFWLACDSVPCFKNDEEIAHHAATNWTKFAAWVQKEQLLLVRYEELIRQSASELRRICDFVGLSYNERMINKNYRPSAFGGLGDLKVILGARKSIHGRSVGRGRILKPTLRDIIQQICGRHARELGYSL